MRYEVGGKAFLLAIVIAAALPALADAPKGDIARGKASYMKNLCYTCHGTAGQGGDRGSGPRIAPNVFPWEAFLQQIRRPREAMPRYVPQHVSDQDLADMHAYLMSVNAGAKASEIPLLKD
jgi:mono/diheme cytochrome c family protein